jgi:hypothetical protein
LIANAKREMPPSHETKARSRSPRALILCLFAPLLGACATAEPEVVSQPDSRSGLVAGHGGTQYLETNAVLTIPGDALGELDGQLVQIDFGATLTGANKLGVHGALGELGVTVSEAGTEALHPLEMDDEELLQVCFQEAPCAHIDLASAGDYADNGGGSLVVIDLTEGQGTGVEREAPVVRIAIPAPDGYDQPDSWYPDPNQWYGQPDDWYPEPDKWYPEPDDWYDDPDSWYPEIFAVFANSKDPAWVEAGPRVMVKVVLNSLHGTNPDVDAFGPVVNVNGTNLTLADLVANAIPGIAIEVR